MKTAIRQSRPAQGLLDASTLGRVHGTLNVLGGLWPLVSMGTFEAIMGPKTDRWLVRTVAGLLVVIGTAQIHATRTPDGGPSARLLGVGTASTLAAIDLAYAPGGRISRMYLVDAALEIAIITCWLAARPSARLGRFGSR